MSRDHNIFSLLSCCLFNSDLLATSSDYMGRFLCYPFPPVTPPQCVLKLEFASLRAHKVTVQSWLMISVRSHCQTNFVACCIVLVIGILWFSLDPNRITFCGPEPKPVRKMTLSVTLGSQPLPAHKVILQTGLGSGSQKFVWTRFELNHSIPN